MMPGDGESVSHGQSGLRILTLSCVFPNPNEPSHGVFVQRRMEAVAARANVRVLAPMPLIDYGNPRKRYFEASHAPRERVQGGIPIQHPRWLYPPAGGASNGFWLFLRLIPDIFRLRSRFQFDIIDAHFGYPDGIAAMLLSAIVRRPFTVTLRGSETMHAKHWFRHRAIRWALRRASRVITVSDSLRRFAISLGVDEHRVRTIPNGIQTSLFHPRDRATARQAHGVPADRLTILAAGYLIERKGHHRIIEALPRLRERGLDPLLIVAGGPGREGKYEDRLYNMVGTLGLQDSVRFTGRVEPSALAELMSAADVFCMPSTREGWPNAVNEALACGTPVVATDVGGVRDMITSPDHGTVIPPGDQASLEEALFEALTRSWNRAEIASAASGRSWDQVATEALEELELAARGEREARR